MDHNFKYKALGMALFFSCQAQAILTVHEWGTFTSLVGANGQAQNGMYHEDEILPDFVHNFGDTAPEAFIPLAIVPPNPSPRPTPSPRPCRGNPKVPCDFLVGQSITQKMETPVVYFYSDVAQKVAFDVSFPGGIISQSYPAPLAALPQAIPGVELKNGFAHYEVDILTDSSLQPPLVEASNIYSHARHVNSNLVQSGSEVERFIFYRGLGDFKTQLLSTSTGGTLHLKNQGAERMPAVFLIYTDGEQHGDLMDLGGLSSNAKRTISSDRIAKLKSSRQPQSVFLQKARGRLLSALTEAGLFQDEAIAMIDTWEHGYFKTPGLRILYILGRQEADSILPIQVSPSPDDLKRVFVGRIEVLLESEEIAVLQKIRAEGLHFDIAQLGRMAQPILLRVKQVAQSKGLLTVQFDELIETLIARLP